MKEAYLKATSYNFITFYLFFNILHVIKAKEININTSKLIYYLFLMNKWNK